MAPKTLAAPTANVVIEPRGLMPPTAAPLEFVPGLTVLVLVLPPLVVVPLLVVELPPLPLAAKPTALGLALNALYTFFKNVSPTIHSTTPLLMSKPKNEPTQVSPEESAAREKSPDSML